MRRIDNRPDPDHDDGEFMAMGKQVICPHCNNRSFRFRNAQLNTPGMTFFGLDWANRTASVLVCASCSRIEWYMDAPERI
jgi:predicted nucleic-acid-binding Zn-ribbon protein